MQTFCRSLLVVLLASPLAAQETSPSAERKETPATTGAEKYQIDKTRESYKAIRDNAIFPWQVKARELGEDKDLDMEDYAYSDALIHAAQFPHAELEAYARRDVPFASLCDTSRLDYKLELLRYEGRLKRLVRGKVNKDLKLQGIDVVYEAWVFPVRESTPLCVMFTELPPGLEPQKDLVHQELNRPVAVTGYYFKLLKYEQQGFDRSNPGKHRVWAAPVLIGRSITLLPEEAIADPSLTWRMTFLPVIIGGFTALALSLVYLSWRYRRGDRAILERAREKRNQNPFENVQESDIVKND